MTDIVPRIDSGMAAERIAPVRAIPAIAPVQATSAGTGGSSDSESGVGSDTGAEARRQLMASMADYARIQARISRILDDANSRGGAAAADMDEMVSAESVVVPLPPITTDALEMAEQLARTMARQAQMTRAAHSRVEATDVAAVLIDAE